MANYFIGTSGWVYRHWKGVFYPKNITQRCWLEFYSKNFNSCEINSTFYRQATFKTISDWSRETPADFYFSIRLNKYATHLKKMNIDKKELDEIINPYLVLGRKRGPILIQLPPFMTVDIEKLASFIKRLPKDFIYALEPRHDSWFNPIVYRVLIENNVALVAADSGRGLFNIIKTADFTYIRLQGNPGCNYLYSIKEIDQLAKEIIRNYKEFKQIFIYFNNDLCGHAIQNVRELKKVLGTEAD